MMGQILLYPVNVAGWKGGRYWIDSNSLMFRLKLPSLLLNNANISLNSKGEFEDDFSDFYNQKNQNFKVFFNHNDRGFIFNSSLFRFKSCLYLTFYFNILKDVSFSFKLKRWIKKNLSFSSFLGIIDYLAQKFVN